MALLDEVVKALVGLAGGPEPGELPHRPRAPPVHRRVDAAGVGGFAREAQVFLVVHVGDVPGRVEAVDLVVGDGGEPVAALAVPLEDRVQRLSLPVRAGLADRREVALVEHARKYCRSAHKDSGGVAE